MITRKELDTFIETIEILSNPQTMNQIINSEKNINSEKTLEINSIANFQS
jgi:hypothetical protein